MQSRLLGPWQCLLLLSATALAVAGAATGKNETQVSTSEQKLKEQPIVIETQARDYDQPNLKEFEECHMALDRCIKVCASHYERDACENECPTCPLLVNHEVIVQGVNDTEYRAPAEVPGNTTNIIRLTNEIRNVIENSHNISAVNQNNVYVHQNITTTGGKYGLGQGQSGPCCMVVRRGKCERGQRGEHCRPKRHRLCSADKCKARVMHAKTERLCADDSSGVEQCGTHVKYEPVKRTHSRPKCRYMLQWPYVHCPTKPGRRPAICNRCMSLALGFVLSRGVPAECRRCMQSLRPPPVWYGGYGPPPITYPQMYPLYPGAYEGSYGGLPNNYYPSEDDGWELDSIKCRLSDGTISSDCQRSEAIVDAGAPADHPFYPDEEHDGMDGMDEESHVANGGNYEYEDHVNDYADTDYGEDDDYPESMPDNMRLRRQNDDFKRSAYSKRTRDLLDKL